MLPTRKSLFLFASALVLMSLGVGAQAATYFVDAATGLDTNPGTQTKPFKSIQKAITGAGNYSAIVVAPGIYHESLTWSNKQLSITGAGEGVSIVDPGVAGGGPGGRCLSTSYLQPYSQTTAGSRIQGFTFRNGSVVDNGGGMYNAANSSPTVNYCTFSNNAAKQGGGMYNAGNCKPVLTNCTFSGNSASAYGGGMYNAATSGPTVTDCTFSNNGAYGIGTAGGGMFNTGCSPIVTDSTFKSNSANYGGGMFNQQSSKPAVTNCSFSLNYGDYGRGMYNDSSSPTVTGCTFSSNFMGVSSTKGYGGGMYNFNNSAPSVISSTFSGNSAAYGGGMQNQQSSPTVTNCAFLANTGNTSGGGMFNSMSSPTVTNCTFWSNTATSGGGMGNLDNSRPTVTNCTFSLNSATSNSGLGGGIYNQSSAVTVTNSILWGNTTMNTLVPSSAGIYGPATVTFSDVQGGWTGSGNINKDPLFVDAANGNLRLKLGSPCIDKGTNTVVKSPPFLTVNNNIIDLDGSWRLFGKGLTPPVDMGAYEYH